MDIKTIIFKELTIEDLKPDLLANFNRYQEVDKVWRNIDGDKFIIEEPYIEEWNNNDKADIITRCFAPCIENGGTVITAIYKDNIICFAALKKERFGSKQQYVQLIQMQTSYEYRGLGLGRTLFSRCIDKALEWDVDKIYISAHSAVETQAFYKSIGCVEATEFDKNLCELEPCDCQLEYVIKKS